MVKRLISDFLLGYFSGLPGSAGASGFVFGGRPILIFLITSSVFGGLE
jgi:hypothetical protein